MAHNSFCDLLWIDLEMTGLDVHVDTILEIAVIATDFQLEKIIEGPSLVVHQPESALAHVSDWIKETHGASGLLDAVKASTITVAAAEAQVVQFVRQTCNPKKFLFAGNTVYQDRIFLSKYMPTLNNMAHYRLLDVSTIKELVRAWYPARAEPEGTKKSAHRALADVHESIQELKKYREQFFVPA
jgi:oligoribonuclease